MKYFFSIIFIHALSSCALQTTKSSMNYSTLKNFSFKTTTKEDVIRHLGQPNEILLRKNHQTLLYNDKIKKYHRASININTSTNLVTGYAWVPFPDEKESKIDGALSNLDKNFFIEIADPNSASAHYISAMVQLTDTKNGMTIMYDKRTKTVDAIAFFSTQERSTSSK